DLRALLRLWGPRVPWIAASSGVLVGKALAEALTQSSPREIGLALWLELAAGQWRRPYALHWAVNAMWLAAGAGAAYLGTRLGVFALDEDDGHPLWHALPTTDVSFTSPALASTHPSDYKPSHKRVVSCIGQEDAAAMDLTNDQWKLL